MHATEAQETKQSYSRSIIEKVISIGEKRTDGIEVTVSGSNVATSRFANNGMTQNQSPVTESVSVRVLVDGRQARLSTDQTTDQALHELVDNAITAAKFLEKDPDLLELPGPDAAKGPDCHRFDPPTAQLDAHGRALAVKEMIEVARQANLVAAGVYAAGDYFRAIGNSRGLFRYHHETSAEISITVRDGEASGWAKEQSPRACDLNPAEIADRAAKKAEMGRQPRELPIGQYTVVLEPSAVLDLLGYFWYDLTGTSHQDKVSSLLDKQGEKVFGSNINIVDDCYHPLQAGAPFDGEGLERKSVQLIENGVFKNMVYGRRSAKKAGMQPTGHGLAEPTVFGEYPENQIVVGGDSSLERMISETDRGILITRVWYVREVEPAIILVTGLTQDGTFLIENGKLSHGIKNMRFNISIHEMLNKVLALGPSVRTAGEEGAPAVVPAMKVADFNFTEHSLF